MSIEISSEQTTIKNLSNLCDVLFKLIGKLNLKESKTYFFCKNKFCDEPCMELRRLSFNGVCGACSKYYDFKDLDAQLRNVYYFYSTVETILTAWIYVLNICYINSFNMSKDMQKMLHAMIEICIIKRYEFAGLSNYAFVKLNTPLHNRYKQTRPIRDFNGKLKELVNMKGHIDPGIITEIPQFIEIKLVEAAYNACHKHIELMHNIM